MSSEITMGVQVADHDTGVPVVVFPQKDLIGIFPTGVGGTYLSFKAADWDTLVAAVAKARLTTAARSES